VEAGLVQQLLQPLFRYGLLGKAPPSAPKRALNFGQIIGNLFPHASAPPSPNCFWKAIRPWIRSGPLQEHVTYFAVTAAASLVLRGLGPCEGALSISCSAFHPVVGLLIRPPPTYYFRLVDAVLVCVVAAIGLLIPVFSFRVRPDSLKLRSAVDCLDRQSKAWSMRASASRMLVLFERAIFRASERVSCAGRLGTVAAHASAAASTQSRESRGITPLLILLRADAA
jgi:hypothetical protein